MSWGPESVIRRGSRGPWRWARAPGRSGIPTPRALESPWPEVHRRGTGPSGRNLRLGDESFEDGLLLEDLASKRFDVEANRRGDVVQRRAVRITLADDHTLETERISHISVRMSFDDDLERPHHRGS